MPKKAKERRPAIAVPTMNPITGKQFASDEEKEAFIADQQTKRDAMLAKRAEAASAQVTATEKVVTFFEANEITRDDLIAVFGRSFRSRG